MFIHLFLPNFANGTTGGRLTRRPLKHCASLKTLQGTGGKMITKAYNYFLRFKMEEEVFKETMKIWVKNFRYSIELEHWEKLWRIIIN